MSKRARLIAAIGLTVTFGGGALAQVSDQTRVVLDTATQVGEPPAVVVPAADPVIAAVQARLGSLTAETREDVAALAVFYAARTGGPLWVTNAGYTPPAARLIAEFKKADDWGLKSANFDVPDLAPQGDIAALAQAEITIGLKALKYARHARGGRVDPTQLSHNLDQKLKLRDPTIVLAALAQTAEPDGYLRGLHPAHPQFEKLRQVLMSLRGGGSEASSDKRAEVKLPAGPKIKPGDNQPAVAALRQRLGVTAAEGQDTAYDEALVAAVKSFQQDHGQEPTGIVTNTTRAALNGVSNPDKGGQIQRIVINMERWRWMPEDMGNLYVWDNVPEFKTRVVKNGEIIHQEKIIVGKIDHQTPIFTADMQMIVFHPEWGVPDGIKVNEILPSLRRSASEENFGFFGFGGNSGEQPRVLRQHNLRVSYNGRPVDASKINWATADIRQFQFIQPPGGKNVLGVVKFRFPNKHDVYMHDTPERSLFNVAAPALSHGCMRVHNPQRLAEILLNEDKGWTASHVAGLIANGSSSNEVKLTTPIPVHVTYFTAIVDESGAVRTFGDLYGHDSRVASALAGSPMRLIAETDPGVKAEREVRRNPRGKRQLASSAAGSNGGFLSGLFGN